jgi:hypothetical protein
MTDLWPNFAGMDVPRGMYQMLYDAAGNIGDKTNGTIDFYVDTVGVGGAGVIKHIRYNCYLRVARTNYRHLLFRVVTPVAGPFPAIAETPEGDRYGEINDEHALIDAIGRILQRERTREVVLYLINSAPKAPEEKMA